MLPVFAVERGGIEGSEVHTIETSDIHIDFVRIGSRNIEGVYPAYAAEMMLRNLRVEFVRGEILSAGHEVEICRRHDQVNEALLYADRAAAEACGRQIPMNYESNSTAVTASFISEVAPRIQTAG